VTRRGLRVEWIDGSPQHDFWRKGVFMNQQLTKDAHDLELTTADIAHANQPASGTNRFDSRRENTTESAGFVGSDPTLSRNESPFFDEKDSGASEVAGLQTGPSFSASSVSAPHDESDAPLLSSEESDDFHARWDAVQVSFVDEPRRAVQQADALVAGAIKRLAEIFADERAALDRQWDRGDSVSTEDLRLALQRYRSFFGRLLSV
jgi:hypothetical protein